MQRKHTNDEATSVDVLNIQAVTGPCSCPQPDCQKANGEHPYQKGYVTYEIFGGYSGDYLTSQPCKCCDGKGQLFDGEKAYASYCNGTGVRDIKTGYPNPIPMSREVYDAVRLRASSTSKSSSSDSTGAAALIGLLIVGGIIYGIGKAVHDAFTKTGVNYSIRISNQSSSAVNIELGSYWNCGEFLGWHSNTWKLQAGETKTLSDKTGILKACHIEKLIVDGGDMSFTKRKVDIKRDTTIEIGNWGARLRD